MLYDKYQKSLCNIHQIKTRTFYFSGSELDWLAGILVNHCLDFIKKNSVLFYQNDQSEVSKQPHLFQRIHLQVPLTTSSVMFFTRSLGYSGLSTLYTFVRMNQLGLISHQLVVRESNGSKKKKKSPQKIHEALVVPAEHPMKCVSGQSLSHKKSENQANGFPPNRESDYPETHLDAQNRLSLLFNE